MNDSTRQRGVPDTAVDLAAAIHAAIFDPGAYLPRLPDDHGVHESVTDWQTRAVLAALADRDES